MKYHFYVTQCVKLSITKIKNDELSEPQFTYSKQGQWALCQPPSARTKADCECLAPKGPAQVTAVLTFSNHLQDLPPQEADSQVGKMRLATLKS